MYNIYLIKMRKNLLCPNLKHPYAQAWISKLGVRGFYRKYIESGYDIPNPHSDVDFSLNRDTLTVDELKGLFFTNNLTLNEDDYNFFISKLDEALSKDELMADILKAVHKGKISEEAKAKLIEENKSKIIDKKESLVLNLPTGGNQKAQIIKYLDGTHVVFYTKDNGENERKFVFKDTNSNSIDSWIDKYYHGAQDRVLGVVTRNNDNIINKLSSTIITKNTDTVLKEQLKSLFKIFMTNRHYTDIKGFKYDALSKNTAIEFKSFLDSLSQSSDQTIEDMLLINKELFTAIQQSEITDNIVAEMYNIISNLKKSNEKLNLKNVFDQTFKKFKEYENSAMSRLDKATDSKTKDAFSKLYERFNNVNRHFDDFYEEAIRKLAVVGFKVIDPKETYQTMLDNQLEFNDNVDDSGDFDGAEALYNKMNYSDEANFAMSSKDTASAHLKQALSMVPLYAKDSNGVLLDKTEKGYLGALPIYEGIDTIWGELLFNLNKIPIGKKLDFLRNSDNIRYKKIAEIIDSNPNTRIRNEFESAFTKQQAEFVTVKISKPKPGIIGVGESPYKVRTINVLNTNRNNAKDILYDDWQDNLLDKKNFFKENEDGSKTITNDYIKSYNKLAEALNSYSEEKTLTEVKKEAFRNIFKALSDFGIEVSATTINSVLNESNLAELNKIQRNVVTIHSKLYTKGETNFDVLNPFYSIGEYSDEAETVKGKASYNISQLAILENKYNPVIFEASFITGDGKSKYAYTNNSFMSIQYERLMQDEDYRRRLLNTAFSRDSIYLNKLNTDPLFKERFKMFYLDSMGSNSQTYVPNKKFKDMTEKEKEFARISLYMNNGINTDNKQYSAGTAMFISLINSDKTTHPVVQVPILNTNGKAIKLKVKDKLQNYKELPAKGNLGDAYSNFNNGLLAYWNGSEWKFTAKEGGYKDTPIDSEFVLMDIDDFTYESVIRPLYMAERNRIEAVIAKSKELGKDNPKAIRNYHNGLGAKFIIFEKLNKFMFDSEGNLLPESRVKLSVKAYLTNMFSDLVKDQGSYWREIGITPELINNTYYNTNKLGHTKHMNVKEFNDFNLEYTLNQFVFMFNQMQMFSGDVALLDKKNPDAAWLNYFKRMAKDIAPGLDYNFGEGTHFNTIILADIEKISKYFEEYKEILLESTYTAYGEGKLNIADAQEYTTLDEHIKVMIAGGRLDNTPEINEAIARLKNGTNTLEDVTLILPPLNPMKPVYADMVVPEGSDVAELYYIKSSSIPLIPSLTKGTPLDKLRLAMENNKDKAGNPNPIDRAALVSAVKLGTKGSPVKAFDAEGNFIIEKFDTDNVLNLPRSGFRIQMEIPNHGVTGTVTEGTQGRKLIHNNMSNDSVSVVNGEEYSNSTVKDIFNKLHYYNMVEGYRSALKDLGFNSNGTLINPAKLVELLKEEAISKDYSINDINSIKIIFEGGKFKLKLPLALNKSSDKFQAILNSIITNRVIKAELPGFTAVQASSLGFKVTSLEDYNKNSNSNNITYLNPNDTTLNFSTVTKRTGKDILKITAEDLISEDGLTTIESLKKSLDSKFENNPNLDIHPYKVNFGNGISVEDKYIISNYIADKYSKVTYSDIIVPNYLGNVNINDFIKDGVLDTSRLPEELLTLIGLRIPTQGHNSMLRFRVKGFLSNTNGEMAIVPEEIVAQMGSDFDVDKLFIYRYEYNYKDGKFTKIGKNINDILSGKVDLTKLSVAERNNAIIDLMSAKLTEGSIIHQLLLPNGFGEFPEILKEIKAILPNKLKHNFTTRAQNNIHGVNNDGKVGVAVFSLFSTFNKKLQDLNSIGFNNLNITVEGKKLGNLSGLFGVKDKLKSDVILYLQSAAVDNAKEQLLGVLNINDKTINIAGTMALLGLDEQYIAYILAQPIISEILGEIANNKDITEVKSSFNSISNIIDAKMSELSDMNPKDLDLDLNISELKANMVNNSSETNYKILNAFKEFNSAAFTIGKFMNVVNTDSSGLGSTFASTMSRYLKSELVNDGLNSEIEPYGFDDLLLDKTDPSVAALNILGKSIEIYSQVFDFYDTTVTDIIKTLSTTYNISPTENFIKNVYNSVKSYIYSDGALFNEDNLTSLRNELLYGENNIAYRFSLWAKKPGNKNLIAQRIKPRKATRKGMPNTIITVNTKATSSSSDVNRVTSHFYAMLTSTDAQEKQLAEDMVKYFYLTGGNFTPTSIGKYLNNDILDKYSFSQKIRNGIDNYIQDLDINKGKFLIQFFQNNPQLIMSGTLAGEGRSYSNGILTFENPNDAPIVTLYDDKKSMYRLFVKQSNKIFYEIPTISEGKGINHYEYNNDLTFNPIDTMNIDQISGYSSATIKALRESNEDINEILEYTEPENRVISSEELSGKEIVTGVSLAEDLFGYSRDAQAKDVLNKLIENGSVPQYLKDIAKDLIENFADLGEVLLDYTAGPKGSMTGLNLKLNVEGFLQDKSKSFEVNFAETLIHELLHGVTVYYMKPINIGRLNGLQLRAVDRINKLFELHTRNYPDQIKLNRFKTIANKLISDHINKQNTVSLEERQFFDANKDELYGLLNVNEFISEGMVNPTFRENLEKKNLWTKLIDAIKKLIGLGSTDLTVLSDAVKDLMPSKRPSGNSFGKTATSLETSNKPLIEIRTEQVVQELNERYMEQIAFFEKTYKLKEGDEFYQGQANELNQLFEKTGDLNYLQLTSLDGRLVFQHKNFPSILDIRKGVVSELNSSGTHFSLNDAADKAEKERNYNLLEKFSLQYITLIRQRKDSLWSKLRSNHDYPGGKNRLQADYKRLNNLYKSLNTKLNERDGTIFPKIIEAAEAKLQEIQALNNSGEMNADNISDSIKYLNTIMNFNNRLNIKEGNAYGEKLDQLSTQANNLHKKLVAKTSVILDRIVSEELGMSLGSYKLITEGVRDIGMFESDFLDFSNIDNKYIQSLGYLIEKSQFDTTLNVQDFSKEFKTLLDNYQEKYNVKNLDEFLQINNGKWTGKFLDKYSPEYYERAKDAKFKRENTKLLHTRSLNEKWLEDKRQIEEDYPEQLEQWLKDNNLDKYNRAWLKGGKVNRGNSNVSKYFIEVPTDKWINPKWQSIQNLDKEDPKKMLYNFINKKLKSINNQYGRPGNFLPDVEKSNHELLLEGKFKKVGSNEYKKITEAFDNTEVIVSRDVDAITGDLQMSIPIKFSENKLSVADRSKDLARMIELMVSQEIVLKNKYKMEPILMLYQHMINNASSITDARRTKESSEDIVIDTKPKHLSEMSLFMIQNYLYDFNRDNTTQEKTYGKVVDVAAHYIRIKGMGWNPFSMIGNMTQSITSNLGLASGNRYFNSTDFNFGLKKALSMFTSNGESSKIEKIIDLMDLQPLLSEMQFNKSRILSASNPDKLNALDPMYLTQKAEIFNTAHTMIAILHNKKFTTKDGKQLSIYEGFKQDGTWNSELGENPFDDKNVLFKTRMLLRNAMIETHGNYVRPMKAKKNFLKRSLLIFRTWLPQAINSRIGSYVKDDFLGVESEGRYITVGKMIKEGLLPSAFKSLWGGDTENLSALQLSNFRRTLSELLMIAVLAGIALMMKSLVDWDDLDDEAKAILTYQLNIIGRSQNDLLLLLNPATFKEMLKDPVPVLSIVSDVAGVLNGVSRTISGDGFYKTGSRKDQSVLLKEIMDLIPFVTQVDKNISYGQNLFSDR